MRKFNTEAQNKKQLSQSAIAKYFYIHSEIVGRPVYVKPIKRLFEKWGVRSLKKSYKIDFVLEPKEGLLQRGWDLGCIGIEVKSSSLVGSKFGKAVSQIMDYQTSAFKLENHNEAKELSMIFLLGPDRFHGVEASILMQEGIGLIRINDFEVRFLHGNGMHPILTLSEGVIEYERPHFGIGTGHR
jgi:hypothetical protein